MKRILHTGLFATLLVWPGAALAASTYAPLTVDIRAFGDAAFIGGNGIVSDPPPGYVDRALSSVRPIRSADINILNLEAGLVADCRKFAAKPFAFVVTPAALLQFGRWGFNMIGLANNHTVDCIDPWPTIMSESVSRTVRSQLAGLVMHGTARRYRTLVSKPAVKTVRGLKIGFASLMAWEAGRYVPVANLNNRRDVFLSLLKARVNVRILSLHGGTESTRRPANVVIDTAREFIANYLGDIVFAHHPHKYQGVELVKRRDGRYGVIFYSLGNFLHNGLSVNGDGIGAAVQVSAAGVVGDSVVVYPLAQASSQPGPVAVSALKRFESEFMTSSAAAALRSMRYPLQRLGFTTERVSGVFPGLRIVPGAMPAGPTAEPAKSGKPAPKSRPAKAAVPPHK